MAAKTLKVTLVRSMNGRLKNHIASVRGLGLRRMHQTCLLYTSPSPRDRTRSRMPSSA